MDWLRQLLHKPAVGYGVVGVILALAVINSVMSSSVPPQGRNVKSEWFYNEATNYTTESLALVDSRRGSS